MDGKRCCHHHRFYKWCRRAVTSSLVKTFAAAAGARFTSGNEALVPCPYVSTGASCSGTAKRATPNRAVLRRLESRRLRTCDRGILLRLELWSPWASYWRRPRRSLRGCDWVGADQLDSLRDVFARGIASLDSATRCATKNTSVPTGNH